MDYNTHYSRLAHKNMNREIKWVLNEITNTRTVKKDDLRVAFLASLIEIKDVFSNKKGFTFEYEDSSYTFTIISGDANKKAQYKTEDESGVYVVFNDALSSFACLAGEEDKNIF